MTDIASAIGSAVNTASNAVGSALSAAGSLNMNDFLKLMTTQLQAQDPFNPMDNTQMAAQLAQFSSVAGISQMNTSLQSIASELTGSRIGDAASWIGKQALVAGSTATPLADGSYSGAITLPSAAASVSYSLIDASGNVVHTESLGAEGAGNVPFSWNGKDAGGNVVSGGGPLKLVITAKNAAGAAVIPTTATWAAIGGVQSPASGTTKLVTPLGLIDPTAALQLG